MVLSVAIMAAYITVQATFFPPKEPDPVAVKDEKKADAAKKDDKKADDAKKGTEKTPETTPEKTPEAKPAEDPKTNPDQPAVARKAVEHKRVTLGSVDPTSPYRMLVTFSNRGASIERIELASPRYRALDDFSGYMGHLSLQDERGGKGCKVTVVGAGTPAAQAKATTGNSAGGIQIDDVIDGFGGEPVANEFELLKYMEKTRGGQTIQLNVTRAGQRLVFDVALIRRPLEVVKPEFEVPPLGDKTKQHPLSCLLTLNNGRLLTPFTPEQDTSDPLRFANWEIEESTGEEPAVVMSYTLTADEAHNLGLAGPMKVVKRYTVAQIPDPEQQNDPTAMAYHIDCELEIHNLADEEQDFAWQLDGPNGLPYEGWWYMTKISPKMFGSAGARDIVWRRHEKNRSFRSCSEIFAYAVKNPERPAESLLGSEDSTELDYVGVDAQYFSAVLLPNVTEDAGKAQFRRALSMPAYGVQGLRKVDQKRLNTSFQVTSDSKHLAAKDGVYKQKLRLFAGPKVPGLMAKYDIDDIIEYGWFRMVSIPLSALLHFLYNNVLFNYALAIIALTVIVRGCMYPFSRQAAKNAQIMQQLSPELKKLTEKYKNDLQKRGEAQSELFKKYNYHPLSGCLPMFLQLPIFLGLYRSLAVDIELRQAAMIPGLEWASNLAGPDMLFNWSGYLPEFLSGEAAGWLGPYFNLLPIISVLLLQVHQRLFTPPATDEQTKMTQDMMKYMTLFMGVLFFKVPAGLCIYFITSSAWSVCERLMLPNKPLATEPKPDNGGGLMSLLGLKPKGDGPDDKPKNNRKPRKK